MAILNANKCRSVYEWLHGRLGKVIASELSEFCDQTDYFDKTEVMRVVERGGQYPWFLLNFALWWKTYLAGTGSSNFGSGLLSRAA